MCTNGGYFPGKRGHRPGNSEWEESHGALGVGLTDVEPRGQRGAKGNPDPGELVSKRTKVRESRVAGEAGGDQTAAFCRLLFTLYLPPPISSLLPTSSGAPGGCFLVPRNGTGGVLIGIYRKEKETPGGSSLRSCVVRGEMCRQTPTFTLT